MLGYTLHTKPEEVYRALVEATAFGALTIINRLEEYGVRIKEIINCGGIAEKNPMLMQIYADVMGREMKISQSEQTCALGAAIAANWGALPRSRTCWMSFSACSRSSPACLDKKLAKPLKF